MTTGTAIELARREGRALGSPLRLTMAGAAVAGAPELADEAWSAVEAVFAAVDTAMSRFREDSELTGLCRRSPEPTAGVSRMLVRALVAADRATRITGGRFDPRVVEPLERIGYVGVPQDRDPGTPATRRGPSDHIVICEGRRGTIALPEAVDLGGIGKGLALRWAADTLDRVLAETLNLSGGYLLDAGGDVAGNGAPGPREPWLVGIEDPARGERPAAVIRGSGRWAVATSSTGRLRWERDGRTVHHLIDPRTGEPGGTGLIAVTVAGRDPAWSEVWSKALFLEGAAGIASAARRRGLAAWWIGTDGSLEMTPAARQRTTWVAAET